MYVGVADTLILDKILGNKDEFFPMIIGSFLNEIL
jgi:hypothetical protein